MIHERHVVVVEVEEQPPLVTVDKSLSEGDKTTVDAHGCKHLGCPEYELCSSQVLFKGKQFIVTKKLGPIDCPQGFSLQKVEVTEKT